MRYREKIRNTSFFGFLLHLQQSLGYDFSAVPSDHMIDLHVLTIAVVLIFGRNEYFVQNTYN